VSTYPNTKAKIIESTIVAGLKGGADDHTEHLADCAAGQAVKRGRPRRAAKRHGGLSAVCVHARLMSVVTVHMRLVDVESDRRHVRNANWVLEVRRRVSKRGGSQVNR